MFETWRLLPLLDEFPFSYLSKWQKLNFTKCLTEMFFFHISPPRARPRQKKLLKEKCKT